MSMGSSFRSRGGTVFFLFAMSLGADPWTVNPEPKVHIKFEHTPIYLAISATQKWIAGGDWEKEPEVRITRVDGAKPWSFTVRLSMPLWQVAFSPDEAAVVFLSGNEGKSLFTYIALPADEKARVTPIEIPFDSQAQTFAVSGNRRIVFATKKRIVLWDVEKKKAIGEVKLSETDPTTEPVTKLAFHSSGTIYGARYSTLTYLFDAFQWDPELPQEKGFEKLTFPISVTASPYSLRYFTESRDRLVMAPQGGDPFLWNRRSGRVVRIPAPQWRELRFSLDSQWAFVHSQPNPTPGGRWQNPEGHLIDMLSHEVVLRIPELYDDAGYRDLAFSSDGGSLRFFKNRGEEFGFASVDFDAELLKVAEIPKGYDEVVAWNDLGKSKKDAKAAFIAEVWLNAPERREFVVKRLNNECNPDVATWLKDLGDEDFSKREDARDALKEYLPAARAALARYATTSDSPEGRHRAGELLRGALQPKGLRCARGLRVLKRKGREAGMASLRDFAKSNMPLLAPFARELLE